MQSSSENNFRDFFKNNIDFLFILDLEGRIVEVNNTVRDILGFTDEELLGSSVLMVHPEEYREKAAATVANMLKGTEDSCPIPLQTRDHRYIPVETRIFRGHWDGKEALIGVSRNLAELKKSEERFSAIFEMSPEIKVLSRVEDGVFVQVNRAFLQTFGYHREEVIGKSASDLNLFFNPGQRQLVLGRMERDGMIANLEVLGRTKTGEQLSLLCSVNYIKTQAETLIMTSAINTTDLKEIKSKVGYLYEQQKLLADVSQMLNRAGEPGQVMNEVLRKVGAHTRVSRVYVFEDLEEGHACRNTFEWCNEGITPQIGELQYIPYEIIPSLKKILLKEGRIYSENIDRLPEDLREILEPQGIRSLLVYPLMVHEVFYGYMGFDNCVSSEHWEPEMVDLLQTIANIVAHTYERNLMLSKLEDSELRLKLAIEGAKEGLWDWDCVSGVVYFNDAFCRMLGYDRKDLVPDISLWERLVHPEDLTATTEALNKHLRGETDFFEVIARHRTKSGDWMWILDHGKVVQRDAGGQALRMVGTHIDVSAQKETERQLKESIETKDKLFSIIAHDLRGPVGSFMPVLDLLTGDTTLDEISKKDILEELKLSAGTTYSLLENLLNWSRSQTHSIVLRPSVFNLNEIIEEDVEQVLPIAVRKQIEIQQMLNREFLVYADKETISLVLRNLLTNALKYSPRGSRVNILAADEREMVRVTVEDYGCGMDSEQLGRLFGYSSFQTERGTEGEKGVGIGLILCKDFVERNGGSITVESTPGKGSRFSFTLPGKVIE